MTGITFIIFPILLIVSMPVAYALLIGGSVAVFWTERFPLQIIAQKLFSPTQSFPLLAIPFFILAGELMMTGGLGERLVLFANRLVGRFTGGLAHVSVLANMLFAGVSGSAVADATALGSVMIPWQKKQGYRASFASALNSATATIGVIIPPSIPMVIYSSISGTSIGALFLAGFLPGIIMGLTQMIICYWIARKENFPKSKEPIQWKAITVDFFVTLPAIVMPVLIIGAMITGVTTPTEVSVLAVFYAVLVSTFLYRDFTLRKLWNAMVNAGRATGVVMLIIMASTLIGWIMTVEQIPNRLTQWFLSVSATPWMAIAFMIVLMLISGCLIDLPAGLLLLGPVFFPLANAIGLDLIQLGVMMTLTLAVGLFTPPVGTTLFISSSLAEVTIEDTVKALVPFFIVGFIVILMVSYIPALTIELP
jgi:tripartite ATP-independent transporter DctM subunit